MPAPPIKKKARKQSKAKKSGQRRKPSKKKDQDSCFVLMPFKEPFDTYYATIIRPAITAVHLEPLRGDSLFRSSPIMADIWEMVQSAKVLVADLTEKNANVFYELGLAHALGKPIVLLTETMEDVPFDLHSLRVIVYDKDDPSWGTKLRATITTYLKETLGNPVGAVPSMFRKIVKGQAPVEPELEARVSDLERRISSMRESEFSGVPFSRESSEDPIQEFRRRLKRVRNRDHAVSIVVAAIRRGLPPQLIRNYLLRVVSAREAGLVLDLARRIIR
jgi:hypothetical protein